MPTYNYECRKCGNAHEKRESINAATVHSCPDCGGLAKRVISTVCGVILKGAGFHANDYRCK